jgi:hypothetical protein
MARRQRDTRVAHYKVIWIGDGNGVGGQEALRVADVPSERQVHTRFVRTLGLACRVALRCGGRVVECMRDGELVG